MRLLNAVIGCTLLMPALLHVFIPHKPLAAYIFMIMYAVGALLAFTSMHSKMGIRLARIMALGTTAAMFFYFAVFFKMAPQFHEAWYQSGKALEGIGMLLSGFAMIPVLSCFSCMLKADYREQLKHPTGKKAFFGVPEGIQDKTG
ncbi:MAG: hypothetical protein VYE04_09870 [Pseudomonadota bacterium]|nr:hypothetical protein [Pseudomonadota bacterium]